MKEWLTIRNAVGALLLVMFFRTAGTAGGAGMSGLGPALFSMALLVLSSCFFNRTLCELFSRPFTRFIDRVYFGDDDRDPPPVTLRLGSAYRGERRFDEALAEFERQLEYHPHSPELWGEMIRTARDSGDRDLAETLQRRACRKLKSGDRMLLEQGFSRCELASSGSSLQSATNRTGWPS